MESRIATLDNYLGYAEEIKLAARRRRRTLGELLRRTVFGIETVGSWQKVARRQIERDLRA